MQDQFSKSIEKIKASAAASEQKQGSDAHHRAEMRQLLAMQASILGAFRQLTSFLDGKTTKTEVVNQLRSIATPDVDKVVKAVHQLDGTVAATKTDLSPLRDDLQAIHEQLAALPKNLPEFPAHPDAVKVSNLGELDLAGLQRGIEKAIKGIKLTAEAPQVNVTAPEPQVIVEPTDLAPLKAEIRDVTKAIKGIELPEAAKPTDVSALEKKLDKLNSFMEQLLEKPMGGGGGGGNGTSYTKVTGEAFYPHTIESTDFPGVWGVVVLNPDGSTLSAGSGGTTDAATFDFMDDTDYLFMDDTGFDFMDA